MLSQSDEVIFTRLFVHYLEQLILDASKYLNGNKGGDTYPRVYCEEAYNILTGKGGDDIFIDTAATIAGIEPAEIYSWLLKQAQARVDENKLRATHQLIIKCPVAVREKRLENNRKYKLRMKQQAIKLAS